MGNEIVLGLGAVPYGLTSQQVRRLLQILDGFPLITPPAE
jgi:hypothetical protein